MIGAEKMPLRWSAWRPAIDLNNGCPSFLGLCVKASEKNFSALQSIY